MKQFTLPSGYTWKFGRGFDEADETQTIMVMNIAARRRADLPRDGGAVRIDPAPALDHHARSCSPSSACSGSSSITGTTFSFMAMIGILILIGVVVNNGIVLVAHINNLRATGMPRDAAVVQAGRDRLRPILMTTLTTLLSMLPLAVGNTQVGGTAAVRPTTRWRAR